jgi:hypothetical protein
MLVPLEAQIAAAERELKYRMFVYPKRVAEKRMTSEKMAHELAAMRAILETLQQLERKERLI